MSALEISTAIRCPMQCSYCPQTLMEQAYHGPRLMSVEVFQKALDNAPSDIQVSFAGYAEPYLNKQCSRMIASAASRLHLVHVYTTGIGMNEQDASVLERIQPYNFVLHLPDGNGDMKCNVTSDYVRLMCRIAASLKNFKSVCYGVMHPKLLGQADWRMQNYGLQSRAGNVVHLSIQQEEKKHAALRCDPAPDLQNCVLIPTGELALCCQDYGLRHIVGDLTKQTWAEIHDGPVMAAHRAKMARGGGDCLCRTCEFARVVG